MNIQERDRIFFASRDAATIQMLASYMADQASSENDDRLCAALNGLTKLAMQLSDDLLAMSREGKDA